MRPEGAEPAGPDHALAVESGGPRLDRDHGVSGRRRLERVAHPGLSRGVGVAAAEARRGARRAPGARPA
jgi:hypothetical protein